MKLDRVKPLLEFLGVDCLSRTIRAMGVSIISALKSGVMQKKNLFDAYVQVSLVISKMLFLRHNKHNFTPIHHLYSNRQKNPRGTFSTKLHKENL